METSRCCNISTLRLDIPYLQSYKRMLSKAVKKTLKDKLPCTYGCN